LASTIAVYDASDIKNLNENSNTHPDTFYAQTKLAAEKIVLNARLFYAGVVSTNIS